MAKVIKKATKSTPFMVVMGLIIVAGVGFLIIPNITKALIGTITIDPIVQVSGSTYKATGTWTPQGSQCWTKAKGQGGVFHYIVQVYEDLNNNNKFDPGEEFAGALVNPAACNGDYISPVSNDDKGLGGNWPVSGQPDATFTLGVGSHKICAALIHVQMQGEDRQVSTCADTIIVPPPVEPYCGNEALDAGEECDTYTTVACTTAEGYVGTQTCNMPPRVAFIASTIQNYCTWNPCTTEESCGDGIKNGPEECDGINGIDEHQSCTENCILVTEPYCGDGTINGSDQCDNGADNGVACIADYGKTCTYCSDNCTNVTLTGAFCGDNTKNGTEECDGTNGVGAHQTCTTDCTLRTVDYCGDNVKNGDEECDGEDGVSEHQTCTESCTLEAVPYCGDDVKNSTEQCDGTDGVTGEQTCSADCKIVEPAAELLPVLSIIKTVDKSLVNPSGILAYTVTVSNSGEGDAINVKLVDTLPAGFTLLDKDGNNTGDTTITMTWDKLAAGADVTVKYNVLVNSSVGAGTYENKAVATAENFDGEITDKAITDVKIPKVLGETAPSLTITKKADKVYTNPAGTITYTVTVTNNGDAPAINAVLVDVLPTGFVYAGTADQVTATWKLGDIVPTESVTRTYKATVLPNTLPGNYVNTASVTADDVDKLSATSVVEVRAVAVLGAEEELPETGAGILMLLSGLAISGAGLYLRKRI